MTFYELDKILSIKDFEKICEEIERCGFRSVGESGPWEFEYMKKADGFKSFHILKKDKRARKEYFASLYTNCENYEGVTFISIVLFTLERYRFKYISVPAKSILFTDAPYNEEFDKGINSTVKCDVCKKEFARKDLIRYTGQLMCVECVLKKTDEKLVQDLAEEIIKNKRKYI